MFHSQSQKHSDDTREFGVGVFRECRREHNEEASENGETPYGASCGVFRIGSLKRCAEGVDYRNRGAERFGG